MIDIAAIKARFDRLAPYLDERARRLFVANEALSAGWGGITAVSEATGVARSTIGRGLAELGSDNVQLAGRVRRPGGGSKSKIETEPGPTLSTRPTPGCWKRWRIWFSRRFVAIPRPRSGGSAGASATSSARWPSAVSRPVRNWSAGCCAGLASAFRATGRRARVPRILTAICNLSISTRR